VLTRSKSARENTAVANTPYTFDAIRYTFDAMIPRGTIIWFRQDLRLHDNPALRAAIQRGGWIIPLYIRNDDEEGDWPPGAASRWWLHQSLQQFSKGLLARNTRLILKEGPALKVIRDLANDSGADAVYWNRRYEPAVIARDASLKQSLTKAGISCQSFNAALLAEPWDVRSPTGKTYQVFTPFRKRVLECLQLPPPQPTPRRLPSPPSWPRSEPLRALELEPRIKWFAQMSEHWQPGEAGALKCAREFLRRPLASYGKLRDRPDIDGTSSLSPHLHFGEISVRQLWRLGSTRGAWTESTFASELIWREFAHHLLYHHPQTALKALDARFERFAWHPDKSAQRAWQRGLTGFPIVDAGMRQLWALGWMHNRVRMIVASLLVKNLRQHWLQGARWFWDTLVDADLAANTLNWQWTAGCGADAAPYFRIFNPILQGERFDPNGDYVRRWVPELAGLSAQHIHAPHLASAQALRAANVRLGLTYPTPLVDLKQSREQALAAYRAMRT
jgi:deoxyribodipyrimidine photo-lyase